MRLIAIFIFFTIYAFAQTTMEKPKDVVVWGETITTIRTSIQSLTPSERAENIKKRVLNIEQKSGKYKFDTFSISSQNQKGVLIAVNSTTIMVLLPSDNDPEGTQTFQEYVNSTIRNLKQWLVKRDEQRNPNLIAKGVAYSIVITIALVTIFIFLLKFSSRLITNFFNSLNKLEIATINITPYISMLGIGIVKLVVWILGISFIYIWATFILRQFPYTISYGTKLTDFIIALLIDFLDGFLATVPNIVTIGIIFFITKLIAEAIKTFFNNVENSIIDVVWLEPETARASKRVAIVLIWIFAIVVAYPYIPGSQTEAFKGISVFLGLMLSLGSAGIVGQILGGIVVVYTRAFQTGDFVKIDKYEGNVEEIGVLSTKIKTLKNEEITIPNATLLSATTTNYSRYAKKGMGVRVATIVTIGYDTPWRLVHQMLLTAALRVENIKKEPAPLVLQKALSDFYVEYTLIFTIEEPETRYRILSELHGEIQDLFNENSVQIMSPNFLSQPEKAVIVKKDDWFPEVKIP